LNDLADMRDEKSSECQIIHKDESDVRIKSDATDRRNLYEKLELSIDPLSSNQNSGLVNFVTGQVISQPAINVDNALKSGKTQMESFEQSWPDGFYNPISKVVNTIGTLCNISRLATSTFIIQGSYMLDPWLSIIVHGIWNLTR
jgi:hypothetical protein